MRKYGLQGVLLRITERKGIVYHEQDSLNTLMTNLMAGEALYHTEYA